MIFLIEPIDRKCLCTHAFTTKKQVAMYINEQGGWANFEFVIIEGKILTCNIDFDNKCKVSKVI